MSIAKNTKETFLEEIIDNLSGNTRELPVDCKPRTREEVLLAEIEKGTQNISTMLSDYYDKSEIDNLLNEIELTPGPQGEQGPQGPQGEPGVTHEHSNKDVLDAISSSTLDDISKVSEIENILNDHLENHPAGGSDSSCDFNVDNYYNKEEINKMLGTIGTIIDEVNGEVV